MRDVGANFAGFGPFNQVLDARDAERRISPHRFAGSDAHGARTLDQQQVGTCCADAASKADDEDARTPGDTAHTVLEYLTADGIEHHVGPPTPGNALDGFAEWLALIKQQMI